MAANPSPPSGINEWLEEELRHQYRHDRTSVDPDWKDIFDHNGATGVVVSNGIGNGNGIAHPPSAVAVLAPPPTEPVLTGSEELMPLRGVAGVLSFGSPFF